MKMNDRQIIDFVGKQLKVLHKNLRSDLITQLDSLIFTSQIEGSHT
jgi:hypothetical protein